jgi:hypothetical protein
MYIDTNCTEEVDNYCLMDGTTDKWPVGEKATTTFYLLPTLSLYMPGSHLRIPAPISKQQASTSTGVNRKLPISASG